MAEHRPAPRLFVVRHGQTEWSQNGQTGRSDIPLTDVGVEQVKKMAPLLVGEGRLLDPKNICTAQVSPRQRAATTFHLLFDHTVEPDYVLTEEVREWDYGEYEGLKPAEIQKINPGWKIWNDGCPGGESVEDMQARVDGVIKKVRQYHKEYKEEGKHTRDVLIVAHGHFSRVLISRWINFPLCLGTHFNVEPGSVSILSYNHNSLDEPALNGLNLVASGA
ncbi:Acid phosphatase [Psilocybe cubensis]|uniref:Acid phosphatase n=2 Tax=Psilocybe cubensis TaxID=181762 RepID=A0ACB8HG29_PSICU|nr:Acid phosphatase [Psilocybe cubensis]KAH9486612.1 Acid phosphatase [Psilocybe cubensis]